MVRKMIGTPIWPTGNDVTSRENDLFSDFIYTELLSQLNYIKLLFYLWVEKLTREPRSRLAVYNVK